MSRRHHYVSQVYLRRFEATPGKVWMYDAQEGRAVPGPTSTINAGQEKGFYALPDDPQFPDDDPEVFESQLAAFEAGFVESMDVAVRIAEEGGIGTLDERILLSKAIAFQHVRTRAWRDAAIESYSSAYERVLNTAMDMAHGLIGQPPPRVRVVVEREEERAWALQTQAMWSDKTLNTIAEQIYYSAWIIARNTTDTPFITSDSPVAVDVVAPQAPPHLPSDTPYSQIIQVDGKAVPGSQGTQAFFPLTTRHALLVLDPDEFSEAVRHQGQVLHVNTRTVRHINAAQVATARRWIYVSTLSFSGAVPPAEYASLAPEQRKITLPA